MTNQFAAYNLSQPILDALTLLGYTTPTPIQEAVIPAALNGRDIAARSQTGTGKTLAFAVPICEKAVWEENLPQALVLEPTRELAVQVSRELFQVHRRRGPVGRYGVRSAQPHRPGADAHGDHPQR